MVLPWIRQYAPTTTADIRGQDDALRRLKQAVENFTPGGKPILLLGPPGVGKTAAVHALAAEFNREIVELNASDHRNKSSLEALLGAALKQRSLFSTGKLILIDEVDGLSGTSDRGGVQALLRLLKNTPYPVVATANEESQKIKALRKQSLVIRFNPVPMKDLIAVLERIAASEGITTTKDALAALAWRSAGDVRAAINDLQTLATNQRFTEDELSQHGHRERKERIEQALLRVFKTTQAAIALPAFDAVDEDIDKLFLWIDANLPRAYTKIPDLARAAAALAQADVFAGRIRRRQYYRFYVYIYALLTAGIALAKEERYDDTPPCQQSRRPLTIWLAKSRLAQRRAIAEKLALATHTSARAAYADVPLLAPLVQHAPEQLASLQLSDDELAWLARVTPEHSGSARTPTKTSAKIII